MQPRLKRPPGATRVAPPPLPPPPTLPPPPPPPAAAGGEVSVSTGRMRPASGPPALTGCGRVWTPGIPHHLRSIFAVFIAMGVVLLLAGLTMLICGIAPL